MFTTTSSFRRIAAIAGATTITCISAITTTYAVQPASAITEPQPQRPCFIVQPHWNVAIDGPAPTCPAPSWQSADPDGGVTRTRIDFGDEYGSAGR
ncbi:hypothetical protein [Nocardioides sp.]|uniref:hypothetical protein n=1 Tax=Nocardioides sp. TaxID=35761 RepID=UPI00260A781D|nr:hypothetical protein [Nocardioides sp.]MCW2739197.1 hypothetical protein [Nocardioides sp.]